MTAEQVVRAAIIKRMFGITYKELAFHKKKFFSPVPPFRL
jgi:hypothetical protein